ncbi:MAG: hypothetical protein WD045_16830 [Pirellulaceae bacterium]
MNAPTEKSPIPPSHHPIVVALEHARRKVVKAVRVRGLAWTVSALVGILLAAGLIDFLLRQNDLGTRWLLSLATLGAMVAVVARLLLPAWRWRPTLLDIAPRIERFFPSLRDRLTNALFFLGQADQEVGSGSPMLRRRQIHATTARLQEVDIEAALNRHLANRSVLLTFFVLMGATLVVLAVPVGAATAASRLLMPWAGFEWPRTHHLAVVEPPKTVALGSTLFLEVEDLNGKLPEQVQLQLQFEEEPVNTFPMRFDFSRERMVYRLENVTRPFRFRAEGGDDDTMRWHDVDVIKPPRFDAIEVALISPEYTRWESVSSPRSIIALAGTEVRVSGRVDLPIKEARIRAELGSEKKAFPLEVTADGLGFGPVESGEQSFVVTDSGTYWIEVTTPSDLVREETERYPIRAIDDRPPTVEWLQPQANLSLTPQAILPLSARVRDDLAIGSVGLRIEVDGEEKPLVSQTLWEDDDPREMRPPPQSLSSGGRIEREVEHELSLAELEGLEPGMVLRLTVTGTDYLPQTGESLPRLITIITEEQLDQRVVRQQREIITKLAESRRLQQNARQQTRAVEIDLEERESSEEIGQANLLNSQQNQRSVRERLVTGSDSVQARVDSLLDELKQNQAEDHDAAEQLRGVRDLIEQMDAQELAEIDKELSELRRRSTSGATSGEKSSEPMRGPNGAEQAGSDPQAADAEPASEDSVSEDGAPQDGVPGETPTDKDSPTSEPQPGEDPRPEETTESTLAESLARIGSRQEQVDQRLESLQSDLSRWDTFRRFGLEMRELENRQRELSERTERQQAETLGTDAEQLTPAQRSELKQMAEQQANLGTELDRIQERMQRMLEQGSEQPEDVTDTIRDAMHENQQEAISQQMRQASSELERNQLGASRETQERIEQALSDVQDTLRDRRETDPKRLREKLEEAQQDLKQLEEKRKELQKKAEDLAQQPETPENQRALEKLKEESRDLKAEAERMARKLERLTAKQAAQSVREAAQRLGEAAESENLDAPGLAEQMDQAEQDLEQADDQLEERQEQVTKDLAEEEIVRLKQSIESMILRQKRIRDEVVRLGEAEDQRGKLTPAQQDTLRGVSLEQAGLAQETREFGESISTAEVFYLSLRWTSDVMTELSRTLDEGLVDANTRRLAGDAVMRLEQLLEALEEAESENQEQSQQEEPSGEDQPQEEPQDGAPTRDGIPQGAQLRLLRMMQASINDRVERLTELAAEQPEQVTDLPAELSRIAAEQGQLSDLTLNLVQPIAEDLDDLDLLEEEQVEP